MFNKKKIKELENEVKRLCGKLADLELEVKVWTHLYISVPQGFGYGNKEEKVRIANVVEDLLKILGYKISYEYTAERERFPLEKVKEKKKIKKVVKKK